MDRNPKPAASARVRLVRQKDQSLLLTVAIIHNGQLDWHRERVSSTLSLSDSHDLAISNAAKRFGLQGVRSQAVLPFL